MNCNERTSKNVFLIGDYNAICDRCGKKFKASDLKMEWDNLFVCEPCWEVRQPQDFVRGVADNQRVPIPRPEAPDTFTS